MPVTGEALYFEEALESCLFQMPDDYIITIIFDKPSNLVKEIAEKYVKQFQNISIKHSPGDGIVAALNHGLLTRTSAFIARMDCDDVMVRGRIKKQFNYLKENTRVICLGTQIEIINASNQTISFSSYPIDHDSIVTELSNQNPIAHPTVMYRRESVISAGMYRDIFSGAEDFELWTRLTKIGELSNLNDALLKYRAHTGQVTQQNRIKLMVLTSLVRINFILTQAQEEGIYLVAGDEDSMYKAHKNALYRLKIFNRNLYSTERKIICLQLNHIPESNQLVLQFYKEFIPVLFKLKILAVNSNLKNWATRLIQAIEYKIKKWVIFVFKNESYPYIAKKLKSLCPMNRFFKNID